MAQHCYLQTVANVAPQRLCTYSEGILQQCRRYNATRLRICNVYRLARRNRTMAIDSAHKPHPKNGPQVGSIMTSKINPN